MRAPSPLRPVVGRGAASPRLHHASRPPDLSVRAGTDELVWGYRYDRFVYALMTGHRDGVPTALDASTDRMDLKEGPDLGRALEAVSLPGRVRALAACRVGYLLSYADLEDPGLDAGPRFNNAGFWQLPIPVTRDLSVDPDDVVIYDAPGYAPLREFLQKNKIRHVLLTGYATDMCYCKTTAGYENLSKDFDVFLVGDATLATFPANDTPRFATNAAISLASLNQLITQISWVRYTSPASAQRP